MPAGSHRSRGVARPGDRPWGFWRTWTHHSDFPGAFQYGWTPFKTVPIFARLKLIGAGFGLGMVRSALLRENSSMHHLHELRIPILLSNNVVSLRPAEFEAA